MHNLPHFIRRKAFQLESILKSTTHQSSQLVQVTEAYHEETEASNVFGVAQQKPWYFSGGKRYPVEAKKKRKTNKRLAKLLPSEDPWTDRITNQLMFVPPNYHDIQMSGQLKTILLYNGLGPWNVKQGNFEKCFIILRVINCFLLSFFMGDKKKKTGRDVFKSAKCPVNTCRITANRDEISKADMVLYKDHFIPTGVARPAKQIFMLYFLECPYHTQHIKVPDAFNWTSTYRYYT